MKKIITSITTMFILYANVIAMDQMTFPSRIYLQNKYVATVSTTTGKYTDHYSVKLSTGLTEKELKELVIVLIQTIEYDQEIDTHRFNEIEKILKK